ncbi:hypothetical protein GCM10025870_17490 [Agromyces marinus]|uniref:Carbohydrate kinase PfkB domain-containing protein n=1 Tax=Agromyces marinus TaxID=1389020 RepID=A0ABM8H1L6_9MICO|nr:PfkB family carbohydrate kinase [Agromyces marinus]BDZ54676.1 hypothetical protein GCM10025870_17490 [Agromyces marinus]
MVDTSGGTLLAAARAGATVVKPNRDELAETTGLADPVEGAHALLDAGARIAVVSLGADGLLVLDRDHRDRIVRARPPALRGNATGAGDAAVAAVLAELVADEPLDLARLARRATAWSASAVLMPFAGELSPDRDDLAARVEVTDDTDDTLESPR